MFEMSLTYSDAEAVREVVNQGIDSRLEGFTSSEFYWSDDTGILRLECRVDESELQILIRRLLEINPVKCENCGNSKDIIPNNEDGGFTCNKCGNWLWYNDSAEMLADNIVYVQYGYEVV